MPIYNLLSCSGFTEGAGGWVASTGCLQGRIGLVLLFFIVALVRKWGGEEIGMDFNFAFGLILSLIPYLLVITFFGSFKIALVIGLVGMLAGGYGGGIIFGGSEGDY